MIRDRMTRKISIHLISLLLILLIGGFASARNEGDASAQSLVDRARKLQDAWSAGTPAVQVRTEIEIQTAKGKSTQGSYVVTWISPSNWNEDLEFSNYKQLRVHNSEGYWQQRSLSFKPELIFQIEPMLDIRSALELAGKQTLSKPKTSNKNGVRERCTDVRWQAGTQRVLCFDDATGNLLSIDYPQGENQHAPSVSRIEYSEFHELGDKRIPFQVRAFKGKRIVATASIADVKPISSEGHGPVTAPPNSEFWPQCSKIQPPELLNHISPRYPQEARSSGEQGNVVFYAVIETDGKLSHLTLIQPATPRLEIASLDAIRQWRYKPALCGGTAIRTETSISVDFALHQ